MTKKLLSLLLALVMVLGLATTAFAADTGDTPPATDTGDTLPAGNCSITVNNAKEGQTYNLYKMLDLDVNEIMTAYTYTLNNTWADFFTTGAGNEYVTIVGQDIVTWKDNKKGDADVAAFAKAAEAYANSQDSVATKTPGKDESFTFDGLTSGYYLVTSTLGTKATVGTTPSKKAEINEKNEAPSNEKQVQEDNGNAWGKDNDADVGQVVNFKSTITVEAGAENYVFHDTMSKGLTLNPASIKVYLHPKNGVSETEVTSGNYTLNTNTGNDETFTISFVQTYLDKLSVGDKLVITYSATLNENAVIGNSGNPNESKVSYGNKTTQDSTPPSTTTTYTWSIPVFKYTTNENKQTPLSGAKFKLTKKEANAGESDYIKFVLTKADTDQDYYRVATTAEAANSITEITTRASGKFTIEGLDADTYYLVETEAPQGYNKLADSIKVTIAATQDGTNTSSEISYEFNGTTNADVDLIEVENVSGSTLPSTGGIGTTIFYVVGAVLVLAAATLLITKKRSAKR